MAQPGCFATLLTLFATIFGIFFVVDENAETGVYIEDIFLSQGTVIYDEPDGTVINTTPEGLFWAGIGTDESGEWVFGFYILDDMLALEGWVKVPSDNLAVIEDFDLLRAQTLEALIPNSENRNVDS